MARFYREADVDIELIRAHRIVVIGYGSQGRPQTLNLRDSGCQVSVALHEGSKSRALAISDGIEVTSVPEGARFGDALVFCTPDGPMADIYRSGVAPHLRENQLLLFAHGFNIHYRLIEPPDFVDVAMVSPKGAGPGVRSEFLKGGGLPGLVAVHQDRSGQAFQKALGYGWGIGCGKAGMMETTFKEETETDLFGEQAVLCGGIPELIKAGFQTLVDAGYQPEAAYFECLHETKLIVDMLYEGGLTYMRGRISDTAEWGGYNAGPAVVGLESREAMKKILEAIQDGSFAKKWISENAAGLPQMKRFREEERSLEVERVGAELRKIMPSLGSGERG